MKNVTVYSTKVCPYCVQAKQLLESLGIPYIEIFVDQDLALRQKMEEISGRRTVPQIFIGDRHVGGYTDLKALHEYGELQDWVK